MVSLEQAKTLTPLLALNVQRATCNVQRIARLSNFHTVSPRIPQKIQFFYRQNFWSGGVRLPSKMSVHSGDSYAIFTS